MPDASNEHISRPVAAKMTPDELNEARRKFEAGQTTRRAALRKIGITAGAAFFAMFAVDDLARIAGKRLEQMHVDNKIADDLAKELRSVGVAFAGGTGSSSPGSCISISGNNYWNPCSQRCDRLYPGGKLNPTNTLCHETCDHCEATAEAACRSGAATPGDVYTYWTPGCYF